MFPLLSVLTCGLETWVATSCLARSYSRRRSNSKLEFLEGSQTYPFFKPPWELIKRFIPRKLTAGTPSHGGLEDEIPFHFGLIFRFHVSFRGVGPLVLLLDHLHSIPLWSSMGSISKLFSPTGPANTFRELTANECPWKWVGFGGRWFIYPFEIRPLFRGKIMLASGSVKTRLLVSWIISPYFFLGGQMSNKQIEGFIYPWQKPTYNYSC